MNQDPMQGLLFGASQEVVSDEVATNQVRVITLNVQGAPSTRLDDIVAWLHETEHNVLVLTEVSINRSGDRMIQELESSGFHVSSIPAGSGDRHRSVIATKGYDVQRVASPFVTPRLVGIQINAHFSPLVIFGLYSVTNGMTAESSLKRREFQGRVIDALTSFRASSPTLPFILAGDLNVLEPGHRPVDNAFEEHDYAFYRGLLRLGLVDAYRHMQPQGADLSWYGPLGGQRLDHILVDQALLPTLAECGYVHSVRTRRISDHSAMTALFK